MAIANRTSEQVAIGSGTAPACPAFGVDPVTGDTIFVWMSSFLVGGVTHQAPTDSQSNSYTQIGTTQAPGAGAIQLSLWRAEDITGGSSFVVTGHVAVAATVTVIATCISGTNTPTNYNNDTVSATATSSNPASGTSTPAPVTNSYFTAACTKDGTNVATAGSGWAFYADSTQTDNVSFQDLYVEEQFPASVGKNGQFTCASELWAARVASFAPFVPVVPYRGSQMLAPQQRTG